MRRNTGNIAANNNKFHQIVRYERIYQGLGTLFADQFAFTYVRVWKSLMRDLTQLVDLFF